MVVGAIAGFVISWIVSTVVIYGATKVMGEKEGIQTALVAAFVGALIYGFSFLLLGHGILAATLGGVVWVIALSNMYSMGLAKSIAVAFLIWVLAALTGAILPTLTGPL